MENGNNSELLNLPQNYCKSDIIGKLRNCHSVMFVFLLQDYVVLYKEAHSFKALDDLASFMLIMWILWKDNCLRTGIIGVLIHSTVVIKRQTTIKKNEGRTYSTVGYPVLKSRTLYRFMWEFCLLHVMVIMQSQWPLSLYFQFPKNFLVTNHF